MTVRTDVITDVAGTGPVDLSQGLSVSSGTDITSLEAGSYTPTTTALSGLSAVGSTGEPLRYIRLNNIVFVSGMLVITGTSSTNSPQFDLSLPFAPTDNFVSLLDGRCAGNVIARVGDYVKGQVVTGASGTDARVELQFGSNLGGSPDITLSFSYSMVDFGS